MQSRKAMILSLGMLLEKVDASSFIKTMLTKAKEENADFKFTPDLQMQSFALAAAFNQGEVARDEYKRKTCELLKITTMSNDEFWRAWNSMLVVGDIMKKVTCLQEFCHSNNVSAYPYSDTNPVHVKAIADACREQGINVDMQQPIKMIGQFPFYPSYLSQKNRVELVKEVIALTQSKDKLVKFDETILLLGDPEHVSDANLKAAAKREFDALSAWCGSNQVTVQIQHGPLTESLALDSAPAAAEAAYRHAC